MLGSSCMAGVSEVQEVWEGLHFCFRMHPAESSANCDAVISDVPSPKMPLPVLMGRWVLVHGCGMLAWLRVHASWCLAFAAVLFAADAIGRACSAGRCCRQRSGGDGGRRPAAGACHLQHISLAVLTLCATCWLVSPNLHCSAHDLLSPKWVANGTSAMVLSSPRDARTV